MIDPLQTWVFCFAPVYSSVNYIDMSNVGLVVVVGCGVMIVCVSVLLVLTWYMLWVLRSEEQKNVFLANVSHELRTPLVAVILASELLAKSLAIPESDRLLAVAAAESSATLLSLINDLLDMSKVEAGHSLGLKIGPVSLKQGIMGALYVVKLQSEQKNLRIVVPETDLYVLADEQRLVQVLVNLLSNSIKYSYEGGVVVIIVEAIAAGERIRLIVRDAGRGIPKEKVSKLFVQFSRLDDVWYKSSSQRSDESLAIGTGLGLSIIASLMRLMDGTVELRSEGVGLGTDAILVFPGAKSPVVAGPAKLAEPQGVSMHDVASVQSLKIKERAVRKGPIERVLLVDDTAVNLMLLERAIKHAGIEVVVATNGEEAILRCQDSGELHMIIMDVYMPVLGGIEATQQIRDQDLVPADIPIVGLTASLSDGVIHDCFVAGMNLVVSKPIGQGDLHRLLFHTFQQQN